MSCERVVSSNKPPKDREAEQQRWADRQEATADLLRETLEASGARAAEIREWLDSSLPEDVDAAVKSTEPALAERPTQGAHRDSAATREERPSREARQPLENNPDRASS